MSHDHAHEHPHAPIDIHAHYYSDNFLKLMVANAPAYGIEVKNVEGKGVQFNMGALHTQMVPHFIDLDQRLERMDKQGVTAHALSMSQPMVYWAKPALAQQLTETYNDDLATAHQKHPTRLYGLAMLPMHEPELAVKEVLRAAKLPGIRGFYMSTHVNEKEVSHPSLFPVYEAIEASGLPLFLHPVEVLAAERLTPFYLTNLIGNPTESAIAAAHFIFGGVLDRFPKLDIVLPHAGGSFPWLVWRLQRGYVVRADLKTIKQGPAEYLRRFWYDTVGYSDYTIDFIARIVGTDRILMGSDYCFPIAYEQPVKVVTECPYIDDAQKHAIIETNARKLLKI